MQLRTPAFDPAPGATLVCRRGRAGLPVLVLLLWGAPAVWWSIGAPTVIAVLCAIPALLITPSLLATWRNRGLPGNWTVAISPERVWLNLRSADHRYDTDAATLVGLDYSDLREAARHVRRFTTTGSDGETRHHKRVGLDLRLTRPVPDDVREAFERVRAEEFAPRSYLGGFVKVTTRVTSLPVEIADPTTLRVHWAGQDQGLRPGLGRVLEALSRRVPLGAPVAAEGGEPERLDDPAFEAYLADLARSGQRIAAISEARRRRALSLVEARQFVEALEGRAGGPAS